MCRIVFWNLNRKDLTDLVCDLAGSTNADVVVLIESKAEIHDTLAALKSKVDSSYSKPISISDKRFHCLCRQPSFDLSEVHNGARTSVRKLSLGEESLLLYLVHGIDVRNYDESARQDFARSLGDEIRFVTSEQHTNRLILLGDLNMNPYDRGMNMASGLNAMPTRECVRRGQRIYQSKQYDLFYNPMWSLFGDNTSGPAGTIYDMSSQGPYGWSMFDQAVLHYSVVDQFSGVEILTQAGANLLIDSKGRPNYSQVSDHLPILLSLKGDSSA